MIKRISLSLILLLAFFMLQVHNVMPHVHNVKPVPVNSHSHDHNHDDEHDNSLPFSDSDHSADFGQSIIKPESSKNEIINPELFFAASLFSTISFGISFNIVPILHSPVREHIILPPSISYGTPLRAPPCFI